MKCPRAIRPCCLVCGGEKMCLLSSPEGTTLAPGTRGDAGLGGTGKGAHGLRARPVLGENNCPDGGWLPTLGRTPVPDGISSGQGFFPSSRGPPSPISFLPVGSEERHVQ